MFVLFHLPLQGSLSQPLVAQKYVLLHVLVEVGVMMVGQLVVMD